MKFVKSSYEIFEQKPGIEGVYEQIELAGRTCYKSTRPKGQTAKDFVDRMIASKHYAVLEHGTVYLKIPSLDSSYYPYSRNPYSKCYNSVSSSYVTTNYRVILENNYLDSLLYICKPTIYHEKRVTVRFILPIGISREFCRHRTFSFCEQSTRFCNFSSDKFNNEIEFIEDDWTDKRILQDIENSYMNSPLKAELKRNILPLCTKTELVVTGFISDYKHFFDLRAKGVTGTPHPQAKELAKPLMKEFIKRKYI